jgi:hypothetical protein
LGTVLIPMNLVTGLWGMNVHVPGQDIESGVSCLAQSNQRSENTHSGSLSTRKYSMPGLEEF